MSTLVNDTENPFRVGGLVRGEFFADRDTERSRIRRSLTEPQSHLLVYGPRRMGKTSTLEVVRAELEGDGKPVLLADLSTVTTAADMTTRLLQAAGTAMGKRWTDVLSGLTKHLAFRFSVQVDPATGSPVFSVEPAAREATVEAQRAGFGSVLDAIDAMAADRKTRVGVILDEFQEIHRFGGVTAEAHLRGVIQRHERVSYVLAGSDDRLIQAMQGRGRPLYGLLEPMPFGPLDPGFFASWITRRMRSRRVEPAAELGETILRLAGPRTRDVMRLARETFDIARAGGAATLETVESALRQITANEDPAHRVLWENLSRLQRDVLRAVVVVGGGITRKTVRERFGLGATGAATKAALTLVERDVLVSSGRGTFALDNPFLRAWIIVNTLPDLGMRLPASHLASDGSSR